MTAIQIATNVIEKLQEENRVSLETLHKAQDNIRYLERELAEKEKLIKIMEDKLRTGTDSALEMSNRQKEITIRHLELQIQKLLRENEDLEYQINAVKSDICARCETKLLLGMSGDKKTVLKSSTKQVKSANSLSDKKLPQGYCSGRQKMLERIIEHKDKRIFHLSKEVQRLSQMEKELTNKVYRLTKLLPMSHMSSEMLTECLLKEIQLLESQIQSYKEGYDKLQGIEDVHKFRKNIGSLWNKDLHSKKKSDFMKSSNLKSNISVTNKAGGIGFDVKQTGTFDCDIDVTKKDNEALLNNLHKLYNDVFELKHLLASENERLYQELRNNSVKSDLFKLYWEEITSRLNDVSENIQCITHASFDNCTVKDTTKLKEKDTVIVQLQERLREALGIATDYESENKCFKEETENLKKQLSILEESYLSALSELKIYKDSSPKNGTSDISKLKDMLKIKQTQLNAAENHIKTCQNFIEELQKAHQHFEHNDKFKLIAHGIEKEKCVSHVNEYHCKLLQTKLEVAEKNIKTCEDVIEQLQNSVRHFEEENMRLESELHMAKSEKVLSEVSDHQNVNLKSKLNIAEDQVNSLKDTVKDLNGKLKSLEDENSKLSLNVQNAEIEIKSLRVDEQEKVLLQAKLDASEKHIQSLETGLEKLQGVLEVLENEKGRLEVDYQLLKNRDNLSKAYEDDVMSLRNELILKEEENRNLKESLHALESKALEMSHYRKALHNEIENLCKTLSENSIETLSSSCRKAIYKAAVLHSAQALLSLDSDYNLKTGVDSERSSALEEMKHQVSVYLTEVSRIHELITIKEQERQELLKDYLDLNDNIAISVVGSTLKHESCIQGESSGVELGSSPTVVPHTSCESGNSPTTGPSTSSGSGVSSPELSRQLDGKVAANQNGKENDNSSNSDSSDAESHVKFLQEELNATKSVTSYLLSSCTRLEDLLAKERTENAKCARELDMYRENVKDFKIQLNVKNSMTKRLNTLIEMMRSKECNDEITMEQLKGEIKWLVDENQKIFERITSTQSELCRCKEENSRIQNDLDTMKRQLLNEKYEHAKVNNELKHLRLQISNSQSIPLTDV